ncbi:MAG: hypothetical protein JST83_19060 [Bacteroidetes bacterium]|nr:hypothetical protein [Bacteroidota bacterium]
MTRIEINQAIKEKKMPINGNEKFFIGFNICLIVGGVCYILAAGGKINWTVGLIILLFLIFAVTMSIWKPYVLNKRLKIYPSDLSCDQKREVLDTLVNDETKYRQALGSPNYYTFTYRKNWFYKYEVSLLYDDQGYYINSIQGSGQSAWFSNSNVTAIINAIKEEEQSLNLMPI